MKTPISPLGDRVVILAVKPEEVSAGGIILPQQAQQKKQEGVVVAVGPGTFQDFSLPVLYDADIDKEIIGLWASGGAHITLGEKAQVSFPRFSPMALKVGDHVLYSKYAGATVEIDGVEYEIMSVDSVYAVLAVPADQKEQAA